ncbi:uncharacterized protein [Antedon mediterranea]|uniref:uncharacterized protein n=1 Tax=Antedon mediterranea TaxID=105859 RepID=UPI003AF5F6BE
MNKFTNDGSFMEQFRKRMECQKSNNKGDETDNVGRVSRSDGDEEAADKESDSGIRRGDEYSVTKPDNVTGPSPTTSSPSNKTGIVADATNKSDNKVNSVDVNDGSVAVKKKKSVLSFVGKRPGSKLALKTGQVKKKRQQEEKSGSSDSWSQYMAEVKKFSKGLDDDNKNRPLIK